MSIQINLRAPTIPNTVRCWRLFPGSSYRFLPAFLEHGVAFLDIPGFKKPKGPLADYKDLPKQLRISEVVLEKISKDGKDSNLAVSEDEIENFKVGKRRQRNQQAVINFFDHAEKGDLIIMPEPFSQGYINIGVFQSNRYSSADFSIPAEYGQASVPARRVTWLKRVKENQISTELSTSLRN